MKAIVDRFNKVLIEVDREAVRLEETGQKKPYRIGDNNPALQHLHTGTLECPMGFNIEIEGRDWKKLVKTALKTEVYGGGSNPRPLLDLVKESEARQETWHNGRHSWSDEMKHDTAQDQMSPAKRATNRSSTNTTKQHKKLRDEQDPTAPPRQDDTVFPFLDMAGEIRIVIYEYALVDKENSTRFAACKGQQHTRTTVERFYRVCLLLPDLEDIPNVQVPGLEKFGMRHPRRSDAGYMRIGVHLSQVCRQTNLESAPVFYDITFDAVGLTILFQGKNIFILESVAAFNAFSLQFIRSLPLPRRLGVADLLARRPGVVFSFPLLTNATHLEALYVTTPIRSINSGQAAKAAKDLYEVVRPWMLEMASQKRDPAKVFRLPAITTKPLV
ncbi:uncharacterized protein ALTATR162_LOCUS4789 [Alternaria atra]|uniref:Uncharacterized protein n=1 Tax=Alternaria atra TaxID=119953 RepID=A0A8J2N5D2_9PLEO|nr:uncharacterized protein ALTATR162_LOCUS4789 [Alternaria atra]CAG5156996.1 unnamed protein product [Alternaria atra]